MRLGTEPLDALVIPDGTAAEERDLVTTGDIVIGGQSEIEFGVRGRNVLAGERVRFGGGIEASGDCRLGVWCAVAGNVLVGRDAHVGERVHVEKELLVSGDLDIGDDVRIDEGFEANGWINVRSPVPLVVLFVIYLAHLLRAGDDDMAERLLSEVTDDAEAPVEPLVIPRTSRVSDDVWRVSTPARIGDECRLHGNIRAASVEIGQDTEIYGSLRSRGDVIAREGTTVHGDVSTREGTVELGPDVVIRGDVSCGDLDVHTDAEIEGSIRSRGVVRIRSPIERESSDPPERSMADGDGPETEVADGDGPDSGEERAGDAGDGTEPAADDDAAAVTPSADESTATETGEDVSASADGTAAAGATDGSD